MKLKYSLLALFCILAIVCVFGYVMTPLHHKYILSDGYTGYVEITFGVDGHPPIPKEHRTYIYHIPATGKLTTSTPMKAGSFDVYYLQSDGTLKKVDPSYEYIHNGGTRSYSTVDANGHRYDSPTTFGFFLGSREQWDLELKTNPDYQPK